MTDQDQPFWADETIAAAAANIAVNNPCDFGGQSVPEGSSIWCQKHSSWTKNNAYCPTVLEMAEDALNAATGAVQEILELNQRLANLAAGVQRRVEESSLMLMAHGVKSAAAQLDVDAETYAKLTDFANAYEARAASPEPGL